MNNLQLFADILSPILLFYDHLVLLYFVVLNFVYVLLFVVSLYYVMSYMRFVKVPFSRSFLQSPITLPVSILVPAYNEAAVIVESVKSFLSLHYGLFEVIVINDGSSDQTLEILKKAFALEKAGRYDPGYLATRSVRAVYTSPSQPKLVVIDKDNGGKADALNAGINLSRYPLFCTVDADSLLEPEALVRVVKPFMRDPQVVAVGGVVRIANGCRIQNGYLESIHLPRNGWALFQIVEYIRAFFTGRMGWSALGSLLIISGAFGVFKKDTAIRCGGYRTDTVGEDMDLVVRMHRVLRRERSAYKMVFIPDPICWTEAPESWEVLRTQRDRWQRGLLQSLWPQIGMFLNPRYGAIGLLAMPYFVLFEMLGPMIEFGGYIAVLISLALGIINWQFVYLFFLVAILFGVVLSVGAVFLEEMSFRRYPKLSHMIILVLFGALENFGYRQINAWWRCRATFRAFSQKQGWGKMTRKGFTAAATLALLLMAYSEDTRLTTAKDAKDTKDSVYLPVNRTNTRNGLSSRG